MTSLLKQYLVFLGSPPLVISRHRAQVEAYDYNIGGRLIMIISTGAKASTLLAVRHTYKYGYDVCAWTIQERGTKSCGGIARGRGGCLCSAVFVNTRLGAGTSHCNRWAAHPATLL